MGLSDSNSHLAQNKCYDIRGFPVTGMEQMGQSISWKVCQSFRTIQCIVKPLCAPPFLGYCKYKNQSGVSEYYKNFELRMRRKHYQHKTSYSQAYILIFWLRLSHQVKNSLNMNQSLWMLEQLWQRIPILSCHKQSEPISTPLFWFLDCYSIGQHVYRQRQAIDFKIV